MRLFIAPLILFASIASVSAQSTSDPCIPENFTSQVEGFHAEFQQRVDDDPATMLREVEILQTAIEELSSRCSQQSSSVSTITSPGNGTLNSPYAFGLAGDTGYGFSLRMTGLIRPADNIIRAANMFNDRPGPGQQYIIVGLELQCDSNNTGRCESSYFDFEMVGDSGTIYESNFIVLDNQFDVSVFGGGIGTGDLAFLIRDDETNLRLLYRPNMFRDDVVAFEAEPSTERGIEIVSTSSINIRSGPGTQFAVNDSLGRDETRIAFGRSADGTWLQIANGWVSRDLVTFTGNIDQLPITSQ